MDSKLISKILHYIYKSRYNFSQNELLINFKGDERIVHFVLDAYFIFKNNKYYLKSKYLFDYIYISKKRHVIYDRNYPIKLNENNFMISDLVLFDKEKKQVLYLVSRKYEEFDVKIDKSYHLSFYFDNKDLKNYRLHADNFKDLKINKIYKAVITSICDFTVNIKILELIGSNNDFDIHIKRLISKANFKRYFPAGVLDYANNLENIDYAKRRVDLTNIFTITLDNPGAKDYDDAISLTYDQKYINLYVHIADVANYVKEESPIDNEAKSRCFSIYPINGVIPMLPDILSNNYCSLNKDEKKLTITSHFKFDKNYNLIDFKVFESLIVVDYNFYYDDFEKVQTNSKVSELFENLKTLNNKLKQTTLFKNQLSFFQEEPRFYFENKKVEIDTLTKNSLASEIIETIMIYTNYHIGSFLKDNDIVIPYRNHAMPKEEKYEEIYNNLSYFGIDIDFKNVLKAFKDVIDKSINYPLLERNLINETLLKSQQKALYSITPENHFALGINNYTHFTAPIRRYSDLIVHRQLKRYLNNSEQLKKGYIIYLVEIINEKENALIKLERDLRKLSAILYLKNHKKEKFEVIISDVIERGIFINFKEGFSGFISVSDLKDYFYFNSQEKKLYSDLGDEYMYGDIINVKYKRSDMERLFLDFLVCKE